MRTEIDRLKSMSKKNLIKLYLKYKVTGSLEKKILYDIGHGLETAYQLEKKYYIKQSTISNSIKKLKKLGLIEVKEIIPPHKKQILRLINREFL